MVEEKKKVTPKGTAKAKGSRAVVKRAPFETAAPAAGRPEKVVSPLARRYQEHCVAELMKELGYKNIMQVPRVTKVVVNTCLKEALADFKVLESAAEELASITGQRPVFTTAKKSISNFKLRQGVKIGAMVTLRGARMYEFLNRLFNIALPRVRDFKGLSAKAFDGRGNYTLGLTEQIMFPEINFDRVQKVHGMNITIATSANTNAEGAALLRSLGMPLKQS